ncbi:hypothetical protein [Gaetbulibacter sp. PBL-D1]|uniref:hypothetical protein n=1 Tax=Gaetbulibacter sp. PBL-D1 TaxID=3422594 RepID=UPI003D2ED765
MMNNKRITLLVLFLTISSTLYCQENTLLRNGKIGKGTTSALFSEPLGRNVKVKYDVFFKTYIVTYTNIDGYNQTMKFVRDNDITGGHFGELEYNRKRFGLIIDKNEKTKKNTIIFKEITNYKPIKYFIYDFDEINLTNYKK